MRRGASRFSTSRLRAKQSGHKFYGGLDGIEGDFELPEKSEKVRSLSAVGRALTSNKGNRMGCDVNEKVHSLRAQSPSSNPIATSKRFKIAKRFFDDCNGVGHASVPRKLRSAVKKRNREYSLPDSERVNHKMNGIESPGKDGIKKTKQQGSPDWSTRQTVSGPITKDEEEVVETLYALAGMFLNNDSNERLKLEGDSSPENSNLQDLDKSTNDAFEDSASAQDSRPFYAERSSGDAAITNSSVESIDRKQPDSIENAEMMTSDNVAPNLNLASMPMLLRSENGNEAALDDSELTLAVGFSRPGQSPISRNGRKPETAGAIESKQAHHHMMKDQNNYDGPTLWPGLALAAGNQASYLQSSAVKAPVWSDCASKQDLTQGGSSDVKLIMQISEVVIHKKLLKRCATHVYISNFIRSLQMPNSKEALQQANHSARLRAGEGSMHGDLMEAQNWNRARSRIISSPRSIHSDTANDSHDNKNSILHQTCNYHEALTPDVHGPPKQGLDLLSFSAGGNGLKVNSKLDKGEGSRLEPLPKLQVSYFQPLAQLQGLMRFPVPQSQYASPSYLTHQISAAGPQVLPHYYGNSLWVGGNGSTASNNKHQQQNFWAVQVAAQGQGRSGVNCNMMRPQYPKWEAGRQGSVVNPAMIPQSSAPLQVIGSKFASISEQQQQFISHASSLPQTRTNGLNFLVPPACELSRGRFPSSRGTPLQLLCDERI
ncbi:uncharacterized protein LOC129318154 isoform X2 [Prosopis cineraria]|uniref:uncharacterized protein LOC129318154 isoform X2 n=1 Tax=Prosopis cineraria TaxID=364024 RepID=UPI002410A364|nr:uncharacterized protein LOC129318154 isoform X2 [Prosopis cineraria]